MSKKPTKKTLPIHADKYSRIKAFCEARGLKICVWAERVLMEEMENENVSNSVSKVRKDV